MSTEKETVNNLIDKYIDLQRIKKSDNLEDEVDYQIRTLKVRLQSFGIVTEELDIY